MPCQTSSFHVLSGFLRRGVLLVAFLALTGGGAAHATSQPTATPEQAATAAAKDAAATATPVKATETGMTAATPPPAAPTQKAIDDLTAQVKKLTADHKTFLDTLSRCAAIPERVLRIQCYDELSTESGFMTRARKDEEEKVIANIGFWQVIVNRDKMGEETMYLKLFSNDVVRTGAATEKKPELVLRCYRRSTEVYLDWKSLLTENRPYIKSIYITSRFDSENAVRKDWQLSLDKQATFAPDTINFVRQMKEHKVLTLEFTPYNATGTILAFTLDGFSQALDILVKRCYN